MPDLLNRMADAYRVLENRDVEEKDIVVASSDREQFEHELNAHLTVTENGKKHLWDGTIIYSAEQTPGVIKVRASSPLPEVDVPLATSSV